ncbi:MAG: carbamate kinase [Proteobacteria bacterium]|nr:carbamate kinase [Pseudomonadota bacterium]
MALVAPTHTVVDPGDPAFSTPSKPIGKPMSPEEAQQLAGAHGWHFEQGDKGFQRFVASPTPRGVVELAEIRRRMEGGAITIAAGGGGIPVAREASELRALEAVADKDRVASHLGLSLGADLAVFLTDVPAVFGSFDPRTKTGQPLKRHLRVSEADALVSSGQLGRGGMAPKVAEAARFVKEGGGMALITCPDALEAALRGLNGTWIVP